MAKKKMTHRTKDEQAKPPQQPKSIEGSAAEKQTHQPKSFDVSAETMENLKSLNALMVKETFERRLEVEALREDKRALESELTRSEIGRECLATQLARTSEASLRLEIENGVLGLFFATQVDGFRKAVSCYVKALVDERNGLVEMNHEKERRIRDSEREVRSVREEIDEMRSVNEKKECEIELLKSKVAELDGFNVAEREELRNARQERDSLKRELDVQGKEANGLRLKLLEMNESDAEIRKEILKLKEDCKGLADEVKEENGRVFEDLKRKIQETYGAMKNIEVVKCEMQKDLGQYVKIISSLENEREVLGLKILEMEKGSAEAMERMEMKVADLVGAKESIERKIVSFTQENESLRFNLQATSVDLEDGKRKMDEMVQAKSDLEEVEAQQEIRIAKLKGEIDELSDSVFQLRALCADHEKTKNQLLEEVEFQKGSVCSFMLEKENLTMSLDAEKKNVMELNSKILELQESHANTSKLLQQVSSEHGDLIGENKELKAHCEILKKEKTSAEKNLIEAQDELENYRVKMECSVLNSNRTLAMLKNAATSLGFASDDVDRKKEVLRDEVMVEEEIQPYATELESINKAFRNKEIKVQEMKQQVEVMQDSLGNVRKQKSFWTVVSSASTLVAAALLAYVAKER